MLKLVFLVVIIVLVLYFLMIMTRVVNRPDVTPFLNHYYAHRGLHDGNTGAVPENSKPAFRRAVRKGYGIELDVLLTKDNIPVVFHDEKVARVLGVEGYIWDYTYEELKKFNLFKSEEKIPTLKEALEIVDGKIPLIVEIKCENGNTTVCKKAYDILKEYKGVYCIESFHPLAVRWFKKNAPHIVRGQLSTNFTRQGDFRPYMFFMAHMLFNFVGKPDFISYDCNYANELSRKICTKFYRCLPVAWTVRTQEKLDEVKNKFRLFIFEGFEPVP